MKEQILALAVQSGFKLDWAISNCTGQFESFYHAAIESYKAELLKEVGEPVGCHYLPNNEMFPVEEVSRSNLKNNPQDYVFLYTSDQLAAAILKATGPLEKEIERLKTVPMKYRRMAFNAQLQDENNELRTQLAAAILKATGPLEEEVERLKAEADQHYVERVLSPIRRLLTVARCAEFLADGVMNDGDGLHIMSESDFDALSKALDALGELPDDKPGYTLSGAAKAAWALRDLVGGTNDAIN